MDVRRERANTGIGRLIHEWRRSAEAGVRPVAFLERAEVPDRSPSPREPGRLAAAARLRRASLFHATYPYLALSHRVPSLLSLHDTLQLTFGRPRAIAATALLRRNARLSEAVLTLSESARIDICERLGLAPARVLVTPLGVRVPDVVPPPPGDGHLLYVGNDKPHKHLSQLATWGGRAAARNGLELVMVVPQGALEHLARLVGDLPVRLCSGVADHALTGLQDGAVAYVSLARGEGFGLPPLEAAARSVPSVLLDSGAHREVMGDAATYCTLDHDSFQSAVDDLLASVTVMRVAARERAQRWTWEASWASVDAAYERFS